MWLISEMFAHFAVIKEKNEIINFLVNRPEWIFAEEALAVRGASWV